jgi:hypothetical protein
MLITFEEYQLKGGKISQNEFEQIEPRIEVLLNSYIAELIPYWRIQDNLEDYDIDFSSIIMDQADFISSVGGENALKGMSDFSLESVKTSAFSFNIKQGTSENSISFYKGIPLSPFFESSLKKELRKKGLMSRCLI